MFWPTTTVSIYRTDPSQSDAVSPRGDAIDEPLAMGSLVKSGVPFSIKETSRKVFIQETQTRMTVRDYKGRSDDQDILAGDRLVDNTTGIHFVVDERTLPGEGLVGEPILSFDLRVFK